MFSRSRVHEFPKLINLPFLHSLKVLKLFNLSEYRRGEMSGIVMIPFTNTLG